jgi:SpoVK/Ycf46/Vps4 family AAA+-type ATPase
MTIHNPLKPPGSKISSVDTRATATQGAHRSASEMMRPPRPKSSRDTGHKKSLLPLNVVRNEKFSHLLEVIEPNRRRDELILSAKNVRTFLGLLEEFRHGDTLRRHGLTTRSKLLFCGPPGCGKTITAEVFAHELGLPLLVARLDRLFSSFLGETASNISKIFDAVSDTPSVLFLDEFDALARSRSDRAEHNELRRVVNSLLMLIDRFHGRGFLIAATNLEESLDSAIWRRFDEVVVFDLPQEREIRRFLKLKSRNFPAAFEIEAKAEKLKGLSYADIERVCLNAIKRSIISGHGRILEREFNLALREEQLRQEVQERISKSKTTTA